MPPRAGAEKPGGFSEGFASFRQRQSGQYQPRGGRHLIVSLRGLCRVRRLSVVALVIACLPDNSAALQFLQAESPSD